MLTQVLIGLALGFVVQLLFTSISMAGSLVDTFGQFQMVAAYDPMSMNTNSVFGRFYQWIGLALLLVTGAHLLIIGGLLKTFEFLPLDGTPDFTNWQAIMLTAFRVLTVTSLQIALPLIAVFFIADLALALLTKSPRPQRDEHHVPGQDRPHPDPGRASFPMLPAVVRKLTDLTLQAMSAMSGVS